MAGIFLVIMIVAPSLLITLMVRKLILPATAKTGLLLEEMASCVV